MTIPYLSAELHNILAPRLRGHGLKWLRGPGEELAEKDEIAEYDLAWSRKDLKTVDPDLLDRVQRGVVVMPWPGVLRATGPPSGSDAFLRFTPIVNSDWLANGTEKAIQSVEGYCTASSTYRYTTQAIWMVLELDHGGGSNALINRELDVLDKKCAVLRP